MPIRHPFAWFLLCLATTALAPAADGTMIPVSLVYRRGVPRDGSTPLFLYAYGSYGATIPV